MTRNPGFLIDGQPRPREPVVEINLLDGVGIDLRLMPQPMVFEQSGFAEFIEAGGDWPDTVPMDRL